jgi:hypothetical protein
MPTASPTIDVTPREEQAIELLTQRLQQRFSTLPPDRIEDTVQVHYRRFDNSRIRDFVPIFVERNAREDLSHLSVAGAS